jgi:hypothetical protein
MNLPILASSLVNRPESVVYQMFYLEYLNPSPLYSPEPWINLLYERIDHYAPKDMEIDLQPTP